MSTEPVQPPGEGQRRPVDLLRAGLFVFVVTMLVSCSEYVLRALAGEQNEWHPIIAATFVLAAGCGLFAVLAGGLVQRRLAIGVALFIALLLFMLNTLMLVGLSSTGGWIGAAIASMLIARAIRGWGIRWAATGMVAVAAAILLGTSFYLHVLHQQPQSRVRDPSLRNVVLLVMDTTRRDRLSVYGYPKPTSPNLVSFSEKAQVYDQAWSVAPWTPPSHASMLTGLLPAEHGVDGQVYPVPLPKELVTLQGLLSEAGYRTAGFTANLILTAKGWNRDFNVYHSAEFEARHSMANVLNLLFLGLSREQRDDRATGRIFWRARGWWKNNTGAPRFLFVNLLDAHEPYLPAKEDFHRIFPQDADFDYRAWIRNFEQGLGYDFTQQDVTRLNALYDAEIVGMDRQIGRFVQWLADRGELDKTIFIVTADHGERLHERGDIGHTLFQDPYLLHVPLIVRCPELLEPMRINKRVQLDGISGTVLHLVGLEAPAHMAQKALHKQDQALIVAQLQHPAPRLSELTEVNPTFDPKAFEGDWMFVSDEEGFCLEWPVRDPPVPGRLTDFKVDPNFERDVSDQHPARAARLRAVAEALPRFKEGNWPELPPEMIEKMRALGYMP